MNDRFYEDDADFGDPVTVRRLSPAAPALIWGAVMVAALGGASFTVWRASTTPNERLIQAGGDGALRRDVARLGAERDDLSGRLAALERGVGEMKVARRYAAEPKTTGSIQQQNVTQQPSVMDGARFALSLGMEQSVDAARRRWAALAARFPGPLAKLDPRVQRAAGAAPLFDLVAGPFATRADADRVCGALAEQGLACDTTNYAGDPIGHP